MFSRTKTNAYTRDSLPNGYLETIQKGMIAARHISGDMSHGNGTKEEQLERLRNEISQCDAIVVGAGAGLSTSAGFVYSGERFYEWFSDFGTKYGFDDMYSGGFYPYDSQEEFWAYWARYIYVNRYLNAPKPVYEKLYNLVHDKAIYACINYGQAFCPVEIKDRSLCINSDISEALDAILDLTRI